VAPTERLVAAGFTGKIVAGRYKLERPLGAGAVGEVWLAEHIHMRKKYALKMLDARVATPDIVARFEREAVAAANISHPSVVHGTDFGRDEDGTFFLVLEYVQGVSLRKLIEGGPIPAKRALGFARKILAAVGAAHTKGVVHRDLKPENVMIVDDDRSARDTIKVLDFGIAKIDPNSIASRKSIPPPQQNLTRAGTVWGTPTYMAPEQAMGETVDARADIYAVGVLLFEMISGRPPFEGEPLEVIAHQVNEDAPLLSSVAPNITPELDATVATLLKRPREERPEDVAAATALIDAAERSLKIATPPTPAVEPKKPKLEKKQIMIIAGAVAALVLFTVVIVMATRPAPVEEETTRHPHKHSPSVSTSASASAAPSTSTSASVAKKPTTTTKSGNNEKGFGKLKSLFK
jgi:eukaryotic-like serine/threonine-protein kinase